MKNYLTTGAAARMLSVTSDAVLKWIKAGKLCARRTAGGHYRIPREALERFQKDVSGAGQGNQSGFQGDHCWEYCSGSSVAEEECLTCPVFLMRAERCWELGNLQVAVKTEAERKFSSCASCGFYRRHFPTV